MPKKALIAIAAPVHGHAPECHNCGATAPSHFCPNCGQATHVHRASMMHFVHHFIGHFVAFESQLMRSLFTLMLKPGQISLDFFAGKRARYIDPLRLYLTLSVIVFFIGALIITAPVVDSKKASVADLKAAEKEMAQAKAEVKAVAQAISKDFDKKIETKLNKSIENNRLKASISFDEKDDAPLWLKQFVNTHSFENINTQQLLDTIVARLPYCLMLIVPFLALILRITYWRRPYIYGEHLVFAMHVQSAAFVLWTLTYIPWLGSLISDALAIVFLVYWWLALRRVYGGRIWANTLRSGFLLIFYVSCAGFLIALFALWSVITVAPVKASSTAASAVSTSPAPAAPSVQ